MGRSSRISNRSRSPSIKSSPGKTVYRKRSSAVAPSPQQTQIEPHALNELSFQRTSCNRTSINNYDRQISYAPSVNFSEDAGVKRSNPITAEVSFYRNFSYETTGHPFLRAAHDMAMDEVFQILQYNWKLLAPRIVLQVVSNLSTLSSWHNTRQLENFSKGIIKAANTTNMWIVTSGLNVGISKVIGDARANELKIREASKCHKHRKHHNKNKTSHQPITLIGMMREENVSYLDSLDCSLGRIEIENEGNQVDEKRFELNPDHSHYIIVKDSTFNRTGFNHFALQWQQTVVNTNIQHIPIPAEDIAKTLMVNNQPLGSVAVPVVAVLVDGGYECARLILDTLKKETPVVIIRGSGGLADLMAYAYYAVQQRGQRVWDAEYVEDFLKPELSRKIAEHFSNLRENQLMRNLFRDRIVECIRQGRKNDLVFLTVLNMHSYSCDLEDLGDHILTALFKSQEPDHNWNVQMQRDLMLTLDWNSQHLATTEVFRKDPSLKFKIEKTVFERALLQNNREDFVDLFLRQGFQLHKYLVPVTLRNLFLKSQCLEFFQSVCWEGVLGHGAWSKPNKYFLETDLNYLIEQLTEVKHFIIPQEMHLNAIGMYIRDAASAERKSLAILTMWAVFTDRPKLAMLLWKHSDQPVHLALVVSMIYERLHYFINDSVLSKRIEELRRDFSEMATSILDASFEESICRAREVLSEESSDWGFKTAVDIAASANNRTFMSHQCCQKWLSTVFMGKIRIRDVTWGPFTLPQWSKVILCATLIFPMYIWIVFVRESDPQEAQEIDETEGDETDGEEFSNSHQDQSASNALSANVNQSPRVTFNKEMTLLRNREVFVNPGLHIWQMVSIMWSAPVTKFWMFQIFYMAFLGVFSMAVLQPSCGNWHYDVVVCSWTTLIVMENIQRSIVLYKRYASVPLFLKFLEILLISSFIVFYLCVRVFYMDLYIDPYNCKVILCVALLYFYFRLIAIYLPISPTLGPLLYRVKLMVLVDFVNFMRMTVLVIMSGGIVIHVVLYPDYPLDMELFRRIFHRAWFSMFLTPIDDLDPKASIGCTVREIFNETDVCLAGNFEEYKCPNTGVWPYLFSIQYFILLKLILLTLLYALFSATASKLITESDSIWKYQRYRLVMDFASRLRLPAPLSLISFSLMIIEFFYKTLICSYCRKSDTVDGLLKAPDSHDPCKDYSYWRNLAHEYSRQKHDKDDENKKMERQLERLMSMADDFEYQKMSQKHIKTRVRDLERITSQAIIHLELVKHMIEKKQDGVRSATILHMLARTSPYPATKVERLPVPDKFVPWEVMWVEYDPVAYTRPKSDFPNAMQNWVDEDILLLRHIQASEDKLPVLQWNSVTVSAAGISIDRQSWITGDDGRPQIYKLDGSVPRNPMGRTGLRGRGALPRWGPNHYALIVITRWLKTRVMSNRGLEFVVQRTERRDQFSIPGSFVPGDEKFEVVRGIFKISDTSTTQWKGEKDILDYFSQCNLTPENDSIDGVEVIPPPESSQSPGFSCSQFYKGYMDDPWNTDHTWKEVDLWHVHFPGPENVSEKLKKQYNWRVVTEDVFSKLPAGQGKLLSEIVNKLKSAVL